MYSPGPESIQTSSVSPAPQGVSSDEARGSRCGTPQDPERDDGAGLVILMEQADDVVSFQDDYQAKKIVGESTEMCPDDPDERTHARHTIFATTSQSPEHVDDAKLVKSYTRSDAGKDVVPSLVRTPRCLYDTTLFVIEHTLSMEGVVKDWEDRRGRQPQLVRFTAIYSYLRDRLRCVRNDFNIQSHISLYTVRCLEYTTRFHIMAGHLLCGKKPEDGFDPKGNRDMLDDALVDRLWGCYAAFRRKYMDPQTGQPVPGVPGLQNIAEFAAYRLLYKELQQHDDHKKWRGSARCDAPLTEPKGNFRGCDAELVALAHFPEVLSHPLYLYAMKVVGMYTSSNWAGFFKMIDGAPYLQACLMSNVFPFARAMYATQLCRTLKGLDADSLADRLSFSEGHAARRFMEALSFRFDEAGTLMDWKAQAQQGAPNVEIDAYLLRSPSPRVEQRRKRRSHKAVCFGMGEVFPDQADFSAGPAASLQETYVQPPQPCAFVAPMLDIPEGDFSLADEGAIEDAIQNQPVHTYEVPVAPASTATAVALGDLVPPEPLPLPSAPTAEALAAPGAAPPAVEALPFAAAAAGGGGATPADPFGSTSDPFAPRGGGGAAAAAGAGAANPFGKPKKAGGAGAAADPFAVSDGANPFGVAKLPGKKPSGPAGAAANPFGTAGAAPVFGAVEGPAKPKAKPKAKAAAAAAAAAPAATAKDGSKLSKAKASWGAAAAAAASEASEEASADALGLLDGGAVPLWGDEDGDGDDDGDDGVVVTPAGPDDSDDDDGGAEVLPPPQLQTPKAAAAAEAAAAEAIDRDSVVLSVSRSPGSRSPPTLVVDPITLTPDTAPMALPPPSPSPPRAPPVPTLDEAAARAVNGEEAAARAQLRDAAAAEGGAIERAHAAGAASIRRLVAFHASGRLRKLLACGARQAVADPAEFRRVLQEEKTGGIEAMLAAAADLRASTVDALGGTAPMFPQGLSRLRCVGDSSAELLALACAERNVASWTHRVLLLADDSLLLNGLAGDDVWRLLGGVPGARRGLRSYAQRPGGPRSELHLWRCAAGVAEHTAPCFANTFVFVSAGQPEAVTAAEVADTLGKAVATQAAYATLCAMGVVVYRFALQEGADSGADAALLQQACEEALEGAGLAFVPVRVLDTTGDEAFRHSSTQAWFAATRPLPATAASAKVPLHSIVNDAGYSLVSYPQMRYTHMASRYVFEADSDSSPSRASSLTDEARFVRHIAEMVNMVLEAVADALDTAGVVVADDTTAHTDYAVDALWSDVHRPESVSLLPHLRKGDPAADTVHDLLMLPRPRIDALGAAGSAATLREQCLAVFGGRAADGVLQSVACAAGHLRRSGAVCHGAVALAAGHAVLAQLGCGRVMVACPMFALPVLRALVTGCVRQSVAAALRRCEGAAALPCEVRLLPQLEAPPAEAEDSAAFTDEDGEEAAATPPPAQPFSIALAPLPSVRPAAAQPQAASAAAEPSRGHKRKLDEAAGGPTLSVEISARLEAAAERLGAGSAAAEAEKKQRGVKRGLEEVDDRVRHWCPSDDDIDTLMRRAGVVPAGGVAAPAAATQEGLEVSVASSAEVSFEESQDAVLALMRRMRKRLRMA